MSMEGQSDWRDNVFGERLWRSIKYEEVSLAYDTESDARANSGRSFASGHVVAAQTTGPLLSPGHERFYQINSIIVVSRRTTARILFDLSLLTDFNRRRPFGTSSITY